MTQISRINEFKLDKLYLLEHKTKDWPPVILKIVKLELMYGKVTSVNINANTESFELYQNAFDEFKVYNINSEENPEYFL